MAVLLHFSLQKLPGLRNERSKGRRANGERKQHLVPFTRAQLFPQRHHRGEPRALAGQKLVKWATAAGAAVAFTPGSLSSDNLTTWPVGWDHTPGGVLSGRAIAPSRRCQFAPVRIWGIRCFEADCRRISTSPAYSRKRVRSLITLSSLPQRSGPS